MAYLNNRVRSKDFKSWYSHCTACLLDVQHLRGLVWRSEIGQQVHLFTRHLTGFPVHFSG